MPRSPVAPAAPVALDYAAFQARLAPYAHLSRVVAALLRWCARPLDATIEIHLVRTVAPGGGVGLAVGRVWSTWADSGVAAPPPPWDAALAEQVLVVLARVEARRQELLAQARAWTERESWNPRLELTVRHGAPDLRVAARAAEPGRRI